VLCFLRSSFSTPPHKPQTTMARTNTAALCLALALLAVLAVLVRADQQIAVVQIQFPTGSYVSQTNLVVATIGDNGHVDPSNPSTVIFAGESGHTLNYPAFNQDGSEIIFSYSPVNSSTFPGPTLIYKTAVQNPSASRLTDNDPTNITETRAVFSQDGSMVAYSAVMASSWYLNASYTDRLAISNADGSNFEWLFIDNMPFSYMFNQWCQVFDPMTGDLYFFSDFCGPESCLYRYDFAENKVKEILSSVSNSCPKPFVIDDVTYVIVPQINSDGTTKFGVVDQHDKWQQLFAVDKVVAESVFDADQFFDCNPYQVGKALLCISELGRSVVVIAWDGTGIFSSPLVGDFNEGIWPESGHNTLYESPAVLNVE